jgi:hypothetical protein
MLPAASRPDIPYVSSIAEQGSTVAKKGGLRNLIFFFFQARTLFGDGIGKDGIAVHD